MMNSKKLMTKAAVFLIGVTTIAKVAFYEAEMVSRHNKRGVKCIGCQMNRNRRFAFTGIRFILPASLSSTNRLFYISFVHCAHHTASTIPLPPR